MSAKGLSDARPILLLGETTRRELTTKLQSAVNSWGEVWSVHQFDVAFADAAERLQRSATSWAAEVQGSRLLHLQTPAELVPALMGRPSLTSSGALSEAVTEELEIKVVQSLCEHVARAAGLENICVRRMQALPVEDAHAHVVQITLRDSRTVLLLALDSRLIERAIKRPSLDRTAQSLVARRSAIAEARLGLQAVLGTAEVSLCELAQLSEGDVIVLSNKLTEPVQLLNDAGHLVARAKVGVSGADRAISVVAVNDRK